MAAFKPDWKLSIPSFIYTALSALVGVVGAFYLLQSKVEATASHVGRVEIRVERLEAGREQDREQRRQDRDAFLRMEGDVRVIRQIVEGLRSPMGGR